MSKVKIDLMRALEVFVAVAERGSVTEAAQTLHITQSAISQQLKMLEKEMGGKLVDRHNRPLRLTPAGCILLDHASAMLLHAEQARSEVRQVGTSPLLHLRIAMFDTLARTLASAIVAAVAQRTLPIKTVSILRGMSAHHARELPMREVDIVITSNPLYEVSAMERYELIHERFMLALPKGVIPPGSSLREIASRLPLIRYSNRTEVGRMIEQHLRRLRLDIPSTYSFDAAEDVFAMINMGQGWAITAPTHVAHALQGDMSIEFRPLRPSLSRSIMLIGRIGELGDLPHKIADVCRGVLREDYLSRLTELLPQLSDHFAVVDDHEQVNTG